MSAQANLDLTQASDGGVYLSIRLTWTRWNGRQERSIVRMPSRSAHCRDKPEWLCRLAAALNVPYVFGQNWDALLDTLRDLAWLNGKGHVLLLDHASKLCEAGSKDLASC